MKTRDVVIGLIVLVVLISAALVIKNGKKTASNLPLPTPNFQSVENKFPGLNVPVNADRINLSDISGGTGMGESFRTYSNGKFSLTIMADIPAPSAGYFYQGWLVQGNPGDTNFAYVSAGKLGLAKGGYLVNFTSSKDYSNYKKVVITLEKVFDNTPETHILEGAF